VRYIKVLKNRLYACFSVKAIIKITLLGFAKALSALITRWLVRRDAKREADLEKALEVSNEDRKRANEIRDRVDALRADPKLHDNKTTDNRGYRD
jgi:hypothetical protein